MTMIRDILKKVSEKVPELTKEKVVEIEQGLRRDWIGSDAGQVQRAEIELNEE